MSRRPIQLIHPVWNINESELTFDSLAEQVMKEGLEGFQGRPIIRLCLVELSEFRSTNMNSKSITKLQEIGVEIIRIASSESEQYLENFLTNDERHSLQLNAGGIGVAREACTIICTCHLDLSDNPIIWFLDDDLQFRQLRNTECGNISLDHHQNLFEDVWSFHERNPTVVSSLGGVTGCPPLPASSSLLTNLQDLSSHVRGGESFSVNDNRWDIPDYYYDLSENPGRVDTVFPNPEWEPVGNLRDAILCHGSLFRPVILTEKRMNSVESNRLVRGGNTLIYDLSSFVSNPYPTLEIGNLRTRRGDTIWSCFTSFIDGGKILSHNMLLHHGRDSIHWDEAQRSRFIQRMLADLYGAAYYRTISSAHKLEKFREIDDLLELTNQLYLEIKNRAKRHQHTLTLSEKIAKEISQFGPKYHELCSEVIRLSRDAILALETLPSKDELHVALIESWSRATLWKEQIGPRLRTRLNSH